jgi:adenine deaminase
MPGVEQSKFPITRLVDCAMGRIPADLLIHDGRWVSVHTAEIIAHTDIAVIDGRIATVCPDASYTRGPHTRVIEAHGRYLVPGLLDAHMHVESGMLTVTEFVRAVVPHGTTGIFIDPHEMANIFGLPGVRLFVDEAALQPIHVWVQMPSCVPSAPGLETSGSAIGPAEVAEAMTWPGIIGLGEMMSFISVANSDPKIHAELSATRAAGKVIGGHYPAPDLGREFHAYLAGGSQDDHEGTREEDAIARARQGMKVMMRYGSAWHDVATQVRAITEKHVDPRNFLLCTDDSHSGTLVNDGHMDRVLRHAISQGLEPIVAIQMATLNTAEHFGLERDLGSITPGRYADILLVSDLTNFQAEMVIAQGVPLAENGQMQAERPVFPYPDWATDSIHFKRSLTAADFSIPAPAGDQVRAHVIGVIENQAPTKHLVLDVPTTHGEIRTDLASDIAKLAVIERHTGDGRIQVGLVHGFGFDRPCAIGTTVAHDCHQMIITGTDEADMAMAANELVSMGGGQVVVSRGQVIGKVDLRIGGILSEEPAVVVARKAVSVLDGFKQCGCNLNNPNMQLSLLALVVIPELRLSDLGLVDVLQFKFIPVITQG